MADFRKCLLAFALVALLASLATAQTTMSCVPNASGTPTVRAEGLAELLGDIVLQCSGGIPTAAGATVPRANVTVYLSTNLTSRITGSNTYTEVFMIFDEPHSAANSSTPLTLCDSANTNAGVCSITGVGNGVGTYNGAADRPNVYQARVSSNNSVTFFGVPIDPPGTTGNRIIRITNLRGNANLLGVSSTLVPTQIVANISVTPSTVLPINNPQQTVAFVQKGLSVSVVGGPVKFIQCVSANSALAASASAGLGSGTYDGQQFTVRFDEGFASAWKEKNIQTHLSNAGFTTSSSGTVLASVPGSYPNDAAQDVPASAYNSETGFLVNGTPPTTLTAPTGFGPFLSANTAFTSNRGANLAGIASQGTRLAVQFNSIPSGTQLYVQAIVPLVTPAVTVAVGNNSYPVVSGYAVLVSTDSNGANTYNRIAGTGGLAPVTITSGSGIAVYEVLYDDPTQIERVNVPVAVAFAANAGNNLPAPGVQSTATGSFAPLSNVGTYDTTGSAPIPRFAPSTTPLNTYSIAKCSCNLLFPWVVYAQGYDTGIAISNTSVDPFGTTPQSGLVTINYYSAGTPPPAQTTNAVVPGGQSLVFTVSGGGNFGIGPVSNGFSGYVIAQAQFQYCHGYAYISSFGALPTSPGTSEGYLGIVLDSPFSTSRTGQSGENIAH